MSLNIQVTADVAKAGQQIDQFAKTSRIALTNLSLVVQDLPFGFIGIQNNLPFVVKSFQDLSKEVGGTSNAIKSLLGSLTGPAGLFFAFSAVTTGLTLLTQEYGTLGNAAKVLLGIQQSQKSLLESLNKEVDKANSGIIAEYTNAQSLYNILTSGNSTQLQRVNAYNQLNKEFPSLLKGLEREKVLTGELNSEIGNRIKLLVTQLKLEAERDLIVESLRKSTENYVKSLRNLGKEDFLTGLLNRIRGITSGDFNSLTQGLTGAAKNLGSLNKESEFWAKQLDEINQQITKLNNPLSSLNGNLDNSSKTLKNNNKQAKEYLETYKQLLNIVKPEKTKEFIVPNVGGPMANNLRSPFLPDEEDIRLYEDALKSFESITQKYNDRIFGIFNRTLRQPIEDLFDTLLTTGKVAWADFGNAVVAVLKRVASQLIATGIASLIANILAPGAGVGVAAGLRGISTSALGDFLSVGGGANFGGVGPGGLAMTGAVSLSLRGSDLVGAINRTNTNINRIG